MAATVDKLLPDPVNHPNIDQEYEINQFLNAVATAEKSEYLCYELPKQFSNVIIDSTQKTLNEVNAYVLSTDDRDLINLFKRAVRNYNSLVEEIDKAEPVTSFYKHHTPPSFEIPVIHLTIDIKETQVIVTSHLSIQRNSIEKTLILDGKDHEVLEVSINEKILSKDDYKSTKNELILFNIPNLKNFDLKIKSRINPFNNDSLEGMYQCGNTLTTQCESEGARRIFFTLDRPDVLSKITTTIIADKKKYPTRLSNGNLFSVGISEDIRSVITWVDPLPKPSYLFACVLGEFDKLSDEFVTRSGKIVDLEVYVEPGKVARAAYSLNALKKAMEFDETYFDREYDLSCLKMVGIPNFNAGAMENKGLMIFNDTCLLFDAETGTDSDARAVENVVSHEYFHNWSGNRVTVRDWFQLALKEAFTDLRAMLYGVWRFGEEFIRPKDILTLWENQFPQDASENAHPIVVDSYVEADSIYDHTTYTKGREIFRTLQIYLNYKVTDGFKKAQNLYFEKYDGKAVTFKELLECADEILKQNNETLGNFERWFHQTGTPTVKVAMQYEPNAGDAVFKVTQSCINPKTGKNQPPLPIPFSLELLDIDGNVIIAREDSLFENESVEHLFYVKKRPIPIIMHGYSAPVKIEYDYSMQELACLMKHSKDPYSRWNAGRQYAMFALKNVMRSLEKNPSLKEQTAEVIFKDLLQVYVDILKDKKISYLAKAQFLQIPTIRSISQSLNCYDYKKIKETRAFFLNQLAKFCKTTLEDLLDNYPESQSKSPNFPTSEEMQIRELRNSCLSLLSRIDRGALDKVYNNYTFGTNFNNVLAAFNILINSNSDKKEMVSHDFYNKWKDDVAVFNNWLSSNASSSTCTIANLRELELVKGYDPKNANHVKSILRVFCTNLGCYHDEHGEGYTYIVDKILEIGKYNPSLAQDITTQAFIDFNRLPKGQQDLMAGELKRLDVPQAPEQIREFAMRLIQKYTE